MNVRRLATIDAQPLFLQPYPRLSELMLAYSTPPGNSRYVQPGGSDRSMVDADRDERSSHRGVALLEAAYDRRGLLLAGIAKKVMVAGANDIAPAGARTAVISGRSSFTPNPRV